MPDPSRRALPSARLVLPATADRDVWLAERRKRIQSSDAPYILGVSEYGSALEIWYDKRGEIPEKDQTEEMLWGTLHEETIAREWARRNRTTVRRVGLVESIDHPWLGATLDRLVGECPHDRLTQPGITPRRNVCALECKHRSAWVAGKWRAGVPDDVQAQVQLARYITGLDHLHVACLIGGNDYRQFVVRQDDQLETDMVYALSLFYADVANLSETQARLKYPAEPEQAIEIDNRRHPARSGVRDIGGPDAMTAIELMGRYRFHGLVESTAKKDKKAAQAELLALLRGDAAAKIDNELAYTYYESNRVNTNLDRLREEFPDAYAACVTEKSSPSFNLKWKVPADEA